MFCCKKKFQFLIVTHKYTRVRTYTPTHTHIYIIYIYNTNGRSRYCSSQKYGKGKPNILDLIFLMQVLLLKLFSFPNYTCIGKIRYNKVRSPFNVFFRLVKMSIFGKHRGFGPFTQMILSLIILFLLWKKILRSYNRWWLIFSFNCIVLTLSLVPYV